VVLLTKKNKKYVLTYVIKLCLLKKKCNKIMLYLDKKKLYFILCVKKFIRYISHKLICIIYERPNTTFDPFSLT